MPSSASPISNQKLLSPARPGPGASVQQKKTKKNKKSPLPPHRITTMSSLALSTRKFSAPPNSVPPYRSRLPAAGAERARVQVQGRHHFASFVRRLGAAKHPPTMLTALHARNCFSAPRTERATPLTALHARAPH